MKKDILARYEQAKAFHFGKYTNFLVRNDSVLANWIVDSECFWYKRATKKGREFRLVDPAAATNVAAFDHKALAKALNKATGKPVDQQNLPIKEATLTLSPLKVRFTAFGKHWEFQPAGAGLKEIQDVAEGRRNPFGDDVTFLPQFLPEALQVLTAPDGKKAAFIRDHNVWIRDLPSGKERALTEDGTPEYSYASNRCLGVDTAVQAQWSPDSRRLFAIRRDNRKVVPRTFIKYVPEDGSLRPQLVEYKMPSPGDEHIDPYHLTCIEVETGKAQPADYAPIPLTRCGVFTAGFFRAKLGWWAPDSRHAFFVDVTRGAKAARVVRWDTHTGKTKVLFEETSKTFVKLCHEVLDPLQIWPLPETNELIWFSERSGTAHLYLYDLTSGKLKNTITSGPWVVRDLLHFDSERRELLIRTAARSPDASPYYADVCKVNIDSGELTPLVKDGFDYSIYQFAYPRAMSAILQGEESGEPNGVSPSGQHLVVTRSRVDTVPVTVVINRDGKELLELETTDTSDLPKDWVWPEPVKLKGADGKTDIYGVVFRPPGFSPKQSYPVVEYSNATRTFSGVPQGSFINSQQDGFVYFFGISLAALGFVVVVMDGRGTPLRENAFSDHHYGEPEFTSDFSDRIAGFRQLAKRYPYMDLDRVGVVSPEHPTNAIYALLKHPEFYKVCVQHCPWDPRFAPAPFEEMYNGTVDKAVMEARNYPEHYAEALSGKLFMIVGMTSTLTVASTFRLVEALQKANKDFDMLCMPNMNHEMTPYTIRREWDYLVRNLQGIEPPKEFQLALKTVAAEEGELRGQLMDLVDYTD